MNLCQHFHRAGLYLAPWCRDNLHPFDLHGDAPGGRCARMLPGLRKKVRCIVPPPLVCVEAP